MIDPTRNLNDEPIPEIDDLMKAAELNWELITPETAAEMIANAPEGGNPRWADKDVYQPHVDNLARDMMTGRFYPVNNIIVYPDGQIQGWHRLHAVIQAGVSLTFPVMRLAPKEAEGMTDTATLGRSLAQTANATGINWLADKNITTIVKGMYRGMETRGTQRVTRQEELDFSEFHREAAMFTHALFGKTAERGLTTQPIKAAVGRASYHVEPDVLERFVNCLLSGIPESEEEKSVIRLRDFLLKNTYSGRQGITSRAEVYGKAARAILAVRDGEVLSALYAVKEDPFPIPGEEGRTE